MRIKEVMKEKGITQEGLAKMLGISQSAVSAVLRSDPRMSTLQKIAEALEVPISALFDVGSDEAQLMFDMEQKVMDAKIEASMHYWDDPIVKAGMKAITSPKELTIRCPHCGKDVKITIDVHK